MTPSVSSLRDEAVEKVERRLAEAVFTDRPERFSTAEVAVDAIFDLIFQAGFKDGMAENQISEDRLIVDVRRRAQGRLRATLSSSDGGEGNG